MGGIELISIIKKEPATDESTKLESAIRHVTEELHDYEVGASVDTERVEEKQDKPKEVSS